MTRTFTPDEIAALFAKLRSATEGGFDLDREIAVTTGSFVLERRGTDKKQWFYPTGVIPEFKYRCGVEIWGPARLPRFSTSIDAALSLVPPNHDWSLHADNGAALAGCAPASEEGCDWSDSNGATPAIALCIAALRARANIGSAA